MSQRQSPMYCKILTDVTKTIADVLQGLYRCHKDNRRCIARSLQMSQRQYRPTPLHYQISLTLNCNRGRKTCPRYIGFLNFTRHHTRPRFIAGSCSCTTTRLSKLITECLKLVRSHCTAYCYTIRERTGVNSMWIINNSMDVIRALEEKQLSLTHVSTWDFSTLYTSLPHAQLKNQLHDLLERVFHTKGKSSHCYQFFSHFLDD